MVLVTGATGFIGSHLIDALVAGGRAVRALVRNPTKTVGLEERGVEVFVGDVREPASLSVAVRGIDAAYHCAAVVGSQTRREIYATNLDGVRNVLEALRQAEHGRLVLLSTVNVLGTRDLDPATEDLPCRRSSDPAADVKIEAEHQAWEYHHRGVDVTVIRPGFVYGPRDTHNVPKLVRAIRRAKFVFLGNPNNVVPIVHVEDVVQALVRAGEAPGASGRIYHITDGSRTTIREVVDCLAELVGCPPPRKVLPYALPYLACAASELLGRLLGRTGIGPINPAALRFLGTSRYVDIRRAREELGYTPRISLRDGMAGALTWMRENLDADFNAAAVVA